MLSDYVIDDVDPHDLDVLFKGQKFESAIFRKVLRDYLTDDDIWYKLLFPSILEFRYGILNSIFTFDLGSFKRLRSRTCSFQQ